MNVKCLFHSDLLHGTDLCVGGSTRNIFFFNNKEKFFGECKLTKLFHNFPSVQMVKEIKKQIQFFTGHLISELGQNSLETSGSLG